jgi:hypothetical protein
MVLPLGNGVVNIDKECIQIIRWSKLNLTLTVTLTITLNGLNKVPVSPRNRDSQCIIVPEAMAHTHFVDVRFSLR